MSITSRSIREEMRVKEEGRRAKMMADASLGLEYIKAVTKYSQNTPSSSDVVKNETIAFLFSKMRELELDSRGVPRYSYNLHYPIDFGREYNGEQPTFADKKFSSTEEVVEFVNQLVMSNDLLFVSDTYKIPSVSDIEMTLGDDCKTRRMRFDINVDDNEVPDFEITRTRINY